MLPWKLFTGGKKIFIEKGLGFQLSRDINFQIWHRHSAVFFFGSKFALDYTTVNKKSFNLFSPQNRTELFSLAMYRRSSLYTVQLFFPVLPKVLVLFQLEIVCKRTKICGIWNQRALSYMNSDKITW